MSWRKHIKNAAGTSNSGQTKHGNCDITQWHSPLSLQGDQAHRVIDLKIKGARVNGPNHRPDAEIGRAPDTVRPPTALSAGGNNIKGGPSFGLPLPPLTEERGKIQSPPKPALPEAAVPFLLS